MSRVIAVVVFVAQTFSFAGGTAVPTICATADAPLLQQNRATEGPVDPNTRSTTPSSRTIDNDLTRVQLRVGIQRPGGGYTIVTLPLETYVARVLAGEAARDSQPAALEALAITVRTFALANLRRHRADGFDLCDQTHCQVVRAATPATGRAATATAGRVLVRDGVPAFVYYTASCGGRTETPSAVWPGAEDPPFLPSRVDDACGGMPEWTAKIADADLLRALHAGGFRGDRLREMRVVAHDVSGRVARLQLDGLQPGTISGQDLRVVLGRTLGWQHVKSTAFDLRRVGAAYRFTGRGSGHGVGLCVIGSARLAAAGQSAAEILERYFPGLAITTPERRLVAGTPTPTGTAGPVPVALASRAEPEALVSLPDEDEGERRSITELALRARDELAQELSVPTPARVTLRFHATTDAYTQATGASWFTSGVVMNGELHLLPLAVLRDRGVLERTIRRGLVHVLADAALATRPLWVREGAAAHFADPPASTSGAQPGREARARLPQPRMSCPDDIELARPVSIGAFSNAHARARACFARQIASGKSWHDVR